MYYSPELVEDLQPYLHYYRTGESGAAGLLLFPFSRRTAHRLLSVANVYPHQLRHTYLTFLYRETADLRLVQVVAGHANIQTTTRYTHHTADEIRSAMTTPRRW